MKIVEVIPSLGSGGGEKFVIDLSNTFAEQRHEITILTLYDLSEDDILKRYVQPNIALTSLSKRSGADLKCMFRLFRYIRMSSPDIVHVHLGAIMYILLSAVLCRRVKYYATIHSEARREAGSGLAKWGRYFLFRFGLVSPVTISEESEKSFLKFYKIPSHLITNGCSAFVKDNNASQQFSKYRNNVDYVFCHAGRIHDVKNQLMLVRSFNRIVKQGIKARLLIAGRAEDISIFNELKCFFSEHIIYLGEQPDIKSIMSQCDAFCLSSKMEGMPITIIEAFSVGCIPIVTPVGGCINMIRNGENGFIAKSVSEDAYFDSLMDFINTSQSRLDIIVENIKEDFKTNYSIDKTAKQYIEYFQE